MRNPKTDEEITPKELVEENKLVYPYIWERLFAEAFGWSKERVAEWAKRHEAGLNNADGGWFYREDPVYHAAEMLVPDEYFRNLHGLAQKKLKEAIQFAVYGKGYTFWKPVEEFDYAAALDRVRDLLRERYGVAIPRRQ